MQILMDRVRDANVGATGSAQPVSVEKGFHAGTFRCSAVRTRSITLAQSPGVS